MGTSRGIAAAVCFLAFAFPMSASSFALRALEKGDRVPDIELAGLSGEGVRLSSFAGEKGLVVIYWATWSVRSPDLLRFAEQALRAYEKSGLRLIAVNADHEEMNAKDLEAVRAKAAELGLSFPVLVDRGLKGYNAVGIISVPTTLVLDRDLRIADAYPGFPSVARDDIPERIEAFLGIARKKREEKAQYLLDHRPKNNALTYHNLGKRLYILARSPSGDLKEVPETAIERLEEAIRRDPDFFWPYLLKAIVLHQAKASDRLDAALQALRSKEFHEVYERRILGFGYLYLGRDEEAAAHFLAASGILPDDPAVLFGGAVAAARLGKREAAAKALDRLRRDAAAKEVLGFDYEGFFAADGALREGTEAALRRALERFLNIEKGGEAALRLEAAGR